MKFGVEHYGAVEGQPSEPLVFVKSLRDACYIAWALREARRGQKGEMMIFAYKGRGIHNSVNVCLSCEGSDDWRYCDKPPKSAEELYSIAREHHKEELARRREFDRAYRRLKAIAGKEFYVEALGSMSRASELYDAGFHAAFTARNFTAVEAWLTAKGWTAGNQKEVA